ncbi:MAG: glutaredoxin family protein [Anaerolineae bacterium]|nr:glutaredoxin family protein [Anaerolineae bacterium]
MSKEIVIYHRSTGCPYSTLAKKVFTREGLKYREVFFDKDPEAERRVREWTGGYLPAPTIVLTNPGEDLPYRPPDPLAKQSPRGVDRGSMISEPNATQLRMWLESQGMIGGS